MSIQMRNPAGKKLLTACTIGVFCFAPMHSIAQTVETAEEGVADEVSDDCFGIGACSFIQETVKDGVGFVSSVYVTSEDAVSDFIYETVPTSIDVMSDSVTEHSTALYNETIEAFRFLVSPFYKFDDEQNGSTTEQSLAAPPVSDGVSE